MKKFWKCSECNRKFAHKNQWHSCLKVSVDKHFEDKPVEIKQAFDKLIDEVRKFGPVRVDPVKTAINLTGVSHFAMIYPQKNALKMDFSLKREVKSERLEEFASVVSGRHMYYVRIQKKEDVDKELLGWLKEAYAIST